MRILRLQFRHRAWLLIGVIVWLAIELCLTFQRELHIGALRERGADIRRSTFGNPIAVELIGVGVGDGETQYLETLGDLRSLNLNHSRVTDKGLEFLTELQDLQMLFLWRTLITDATVERLAQLKSLEYVNLCETQVTDSALKHLIELPNLEMVLLHDTQVTEEGVQQFMRVKQRCLVGAFGEIERYLDRQQPDTVQLEHKRRGPAGTPSS